MTDTVLVVLDRAGDGAELIAAARELGSVAVLTTTRKEVPGADQVLVAEVGEGAVALVDAVEAAVSRLNPAAILFAHTAAGRDVAARVAVRLRRALLTDATAIRRDAHGIVTEHSNYGGAFTATAAATHLAPVVTMRPGSVDAAVEASSSEVVELDVAASGRRDVKILETTPIERTSTRPDLLTADKVVAGGVSLGSDDMFEELVGGLADALGAAVGATRSAVDEGQVPYEAQIGQTGVMVSPKLYIGLGISGAVQHLVGMQTSDTIVAINSDEDAPIFDIADFGIIGDIFDLVPDIIAEIEARKSVSGEVSE
ncbi:electron transfer flavoprotein subunit alpha/FixB family protein [Corynebacterium sp. Q4381]|uniref:electron transfer flavoprotein subunit alpha/FixB family protein n=1 Tax=Corynebacterium sp. Marseille-Q4381 TaxID=3121597 RepID=UPI002FE6BBB9